MDKFTAAVKNTWWILLPKHKWHCVGFEWNVDIYTSVLVYVWIFTMWNQIKLSKWLIHVSCTNSIAIQNDHLSITYRSSMEHISLRDNFHN
jgi:hypothetical protein